MRKDFNKVLTERPRKGHKRKHKEVRKAYNSQFSVNYDNDEDGPLGGTEHMRRPYQNIRKSNSDLWGAIRRFMLSRCGRKWDDVWSEVNRDLSESDDMRAHWRVHCKIEVDEKVAVAPNGKLWRLAGRGSWTFDCLDRWGWPLQGIPGCNKRFYVDPRDGILRKTPKYKWSERSRKLEQPEYGWEMPDGNRIQYIDGVWYSVWHEEEKYMESVPVYGERDPVTLRRPVLRVTLVPCVRYNPRKRQLNSRELQRYGARNE